MEEDSFSSIFGDNRTTPVDALLQLLDPSNISMKSDYNMTQIKIKQHLQVIANSGLCSDTIRDQILTFLQSFSEDMVSLKRKSREEIVNSLKEMSKAGMFTEENALGSLMGR